jgi:hypothetical protein
MVSIRDTARSAISWNSPTAASSEAFASLSIWSSITLRMPIRGFATLEARRIRNIAIGTRQRQQGNGFSRRAEIDVDA